MIAFRYVAFMIGIFSTIVCPALSFPLPPSSRSSLEVRDSNVPDITTPLILAKERTTPSKRDFDIQTWINLFRGLHGGNVGVASGIFTGGSSNTILTRSLERRTSLWDDFDFWRRIYGFSSASANIRPIKPRFDYNQWENFWPPSSIMDHIPSLNGPVIGKSESPISE